MGFSHPGPQNMCSTPGWLTTSFSCLGNSLEHKSQHQSRGLWGLLGGKVRSAGPALPLVSGRACGGCLGVRPGPACLPVPCRPFIKLKENGRANISRSSSSTSSFSSTAGEGEAMEECDSGVGAARPTLGSSEGNPGPRGILLCALKGRLGRLKGK